MKAAECRLRKPKHASCFGDGEFESTFAAQALFQSRRIEVDVAADLRDLESEFTQTSGDGFGFEAIGVTQTLGGALIRSGIKDVGAFGFHGFVDQEAEALGQRVLAMVQK